MCRTPWALLALAAAIALTVSLPAASGSGLEVFAGQDRSVRIGDTVQFDDAQLLSPVEPGVTVSYLWDFDDTVDSDRNGAFDDDVDDTGQVVSWTYQDPGIFTVTLTVTDGTHSAIDRLVVTVRDNEPPRISANESRVADVKVPLVFNATAVDDVDPNESLTWSWEMGDGTNLTGPPPVEHAFGDTGLFDVFIRVEDAEGKVGELLVEVDVVDRIPPVADPGPNLTVAAKERFVLDGSNSWDNDEITISRWTFEEAGRPIVLNGEAVFFFFDSPGLYNVTLTVHDAYGNKDECNITVEVVEGAEGDGDLFRVGNDLELAPCGVGLLAILVTTVWTVWHVRRRVSRKGTSAA